MNILTFCTLVLFATAHADRAVSTQESCNKSGGAWKSKLNECIYPDFSDAGKSCLKHSDCEGACIMSLTKEQERLLVNNYGKHKFRVKGSCASSKNGPACMPNIDKDGYVDSIVCE